MNTKFERHDERCLYGYGAYRDDGIRVEVVRCYEGEWSVFLTRNSEVRARASKSISSAACCGSGYSSRSVPQFKKGKTNGHTDTK